MADYFSHTVVQQIIPDTDMTPLEKLLLSNIFGVEHHRNGWYFFAEENPLTTFVVARSELQEALASSPDAESAAHQAAIEQLAEAGADADQIEIDLSGISWEEFFQDIVTRSTTLRYISIVVAFTCSKMRPDGFGGTALLITPRCIVAESTTDILEKLIAEAGLDGDDASETKVFYTDSVPSPFE
jgi:hypothetical protein